jgi:hypothetical protein
VTEVAVKSTDFLQGGKMMRTSKTTTPLIPRQRGTTDRSLQPLNGEPLHPEPVNLFTHLIHHNCRRLREAQRIRLTAAGDAPAFGDLL